MGAEAEHHQALGPEAPLLLVHLGVIPDRCASKRHHIQEEQHFETQATLACGLPAEAGAGRRWTRSSRNGGTALQEECIM